MLDAQECAARVLEEMRPQGAVPNIACYFSAVRALGLSRQWQAAAGALAEMRSQAPSQSYRSNRGTGGDRQTGSPGRDASGARMI